MVRSARPRNPRQINPNPGTPMVVSRASVTPIPAAGFAANCLERGRTG
jgi:hypothetical protein